MLQNAEAGGFDQCCAEYSLFHPSHQASLCLLNGNRSVAQHANLIDRTMPEDDPDRLDAARAVTEMVLGLRIRHA